MRSGILGGTFNPIHLAHLKIAQAACRACRLDRVLFIPAADPPHKPIAGEVSFNHRLAMVEAAVAGSPEFQVSDIEAHRPGKSYSVQTLELLKRRFPTDQFYFIIGLDSFRDLASWHDYEQIFALTNLVVATRPGIAGPLPELLPVAIRGQFCYDAASKNLRHASGNEIIFLTDLEWDISSTEIRALIAAGEGFEHLVPPGVAAYIHRHRLYRND